MNQRLSVICIETIESSGMAVTPLNDCDLTRSLLQTETDSIIDVVNAEL